MKRLSIFALCIITGVVIGFLAATRPWQSNPTTSSSTNQSKMTPTESETATNSQRRCTADDLSLKVQPAQNGNAAGSAYLDAVVKNESGRSCDLLPQPNISLRNSDNNTVGQSASQTDSNGATVSLPSDSSAYVLLRFASSGAAADNSCQTGVTAMRLTLAGGNGYISAPINQTTWCPGFSAGPYSLSPQ